MVAENNLKLSVSNFGSIAEAEIDLRPLTVFVGPSNTGKSYLATLVYSLHRAFGGGSAVVGGRYGGSFLRTRGILSGLAADPVLDGLDVPEDTTLALANWLESDVWNDGDTGAISDAMPDSVSALLRRVLERSTSVGKCVVGEITRCFGMDDARKLIRKNGSGIAEVEIVSLAFNGARQTHPYKYTLSIRQSGESLRPSIPPDAPMPFLGLDDEPMRPNGRHILSETSESLRLLYARDALGGLANSILASSVRPLNRVAHYLPADRTGIMHSHRVVVSSLIRRAPMAGLRREVPLPEFSGVTADFLETLVSLGGYKSRNDKELSRRIEKKMLGGAIRIESSPASYPEFYYQPDGWEDDMPLMNASSMVSELAPVALYLRHVVRAGDLLIIEEPESHLHPAMQVEFVRQLAAAVRSGIRVMLTTHSEWVLDELTNLVRLSELSESRRRGVGGADYALNHDDVGVWVFDPRYGSTGSVVVWTPFDLDFGGFRSRFDKVAMDTYNDYARISNLIENERHQ